MVDTRRLPDENGNGDGETLSMAAGQAERRSVNLQDGVKDKYDSEEEDDGEDNDAQTVGSKSCYISLNQS